MLWCPVGQEGPHDGLIVENNLGHDPTATCYLHPKIGTSVRGRVAKVEGGWDTVLDTADDPVLADIDREPCGPASAAGNERKAVGP